MIYGLTATLPRTMEAALVAEQVPANAAHQIASTPAVASLFAAFLGYNPMEKLVPASVLSALPPDSAATITGKAFFPELISAPFAHGLAYAFIFAAILYLVAAAVSWIAGGRYVHVEATGPGGLANETAAE